jgi:hypothetical protein
MGLETLQKDIFGSTFHLDRIHLIPNIIAVQIKEEDDKQLAYSDS